VQHNALPNGLICLKGGELTEQRETSGLHECPSRDGGRRSQLEHETLPMKNSVDITPLSDYFKEEFFETKKVVYLPL